jgi:hypothetical protein
LPVKTASRTSGKSHNRRNYERKVSTVSRLPSVHLSLRPALKAATPVILLIIIVLGLMHNAPSQHPGNPGTVTPPTGASTNPADPFAPQSSATPQPSTASSGTGNAAAAGQTSSPVVAPPAELLTRLTGFLQAYYQAQPGDTEPIRRQRVAPLVPASVLARLDLSIPDGAIALQHLTVTASLDPTSIQTNKVGNNPSMLYVIAPVTETLTRPNKSVATTQVVYTDSEWQNQAGIWTLVYFYEGGGESP